MLQRLPSELCRPTHGWLQCLDCCWVSQQAREPHQRHLSKALEVAQQWSGHFPRQGHASGRLNCKSLEDCALGVTQKDWRF